MTMYGDIPAHTSVDGARVSLLQIRPPRAVQRATLVGALTLVAIQFLLGWAALRVWAMAPEPATRDELALFVAFGTVLTLQGMLVLGLAWVLAATGRTELTATATGAVPDPGGTNVDPRGVLLHVQHPWREWIGPAAAVDEAWLDRGWLHLRPNGYWRTWHVRVRTGDRAHAERLASVLPRGVWLTPAQGRMRVLRRLLLPLLVAALGGVALLAWLTRWLGTFE